MEHALSEIRNSVWGQFLICYQRAGTVPCTNQKRGAPDEKKEKKKENKTENKTRKKGRVDDLSEEQILKKLTEQQRRGKKKGTKEEKKEKKRNMIKIRRKKNVSAGG